MAPELLTALFSFLFFLFHSTGRIPELARPAGVCTVILEDMQAIMLISPGNLVRVEGGRGEIDKRGE